ncbi:hypothetical protein ACFSBZ_04110 [Amnibacterium flavum]|uniref:hypothetical protein n=1 Tax=Amnibacterium flavum TaxID=2173173 RepID=UPI001057B0BD
MSTFLVPPGTPLEWAADAIRALGVVLFVVGLIGWGPLAGAVLALTLLGLVAPRFLGVRASLDLSSQVVLLLAAWCSVLDLYRSLPWIDIPVHFALNGLLALLAVVAADRAGLHLPPRRVVLVVATLTVGLALAAVWEIGEWAGNRLDDSVLVGYDDSILDMAVGGLGAAAAGLVVPAALRADRWRA